VTIGVAKFGVGLAIYAAIWATVARFAFHRPWPESWRFMLEVAAAIWFFRGAFWLITERNR
jgi:hypothetical protein